jgi:hypothetical protein
MLTSDEIKTHTIEKVAFEDFFFTFYHLHDILFVLEISNCDSIKKG